MSLQDFISYGTYNIISLLLVSAGTWIIYQSIKLTYNLFFHPLRHIPGPWLSAGTYLPELYYDLLRSGRYTREIQKMHEKYGMLYFQLSVTIVAQLTCSANVRTGPIVRINPDEVHCNDRHFVDEIYAGGSRKRDKPMHQVRGSGV
jgi:hypothetical protein